MRYFFFFSSRRRHTRSTRDWSSDVCSSDLPGGAGRQGAAALRLGGTLATVVTHHGAGGDEDFFIQAQAATALGPRHAIWRGAVARLPPPRLRTTGRTGPLGWFGPAVFPRFDRDLAYTTAGYLDLLRSYSENASPVATGSASARPPSMLRHGTRIPTGAPEPDAPPNPAPTRTSDRL